MEFNEDLFYGYLLGYARRLLLASPVWGLEPEDVVHEAWLMAKQASSSDRPWFSGKYLQAYIHGHVLRQYHRQERRYWGQLPPSAPTGQDLEAEVLTSVALEAVLPAVLADRDGLLLLAVGMGYTPGELRARTEQGKVQFSMRLARVRLRVLGKSRTGKGRLPPVKLGG